MQVMGMEVHANEGGVTQTRGGIYWLILPAGCINYNFLLLLLHYYYYYYYFHMVYLRFLHLDLGSSFWGMLLIVASTNLITARIAAGCLAVALLIVLFIAKNVRISTSFFHIQFKIKNMVLSHLLYSFQTVDSSRTLHRSVTSTHESYFSMIHQNSCIS